MTDVLQTFTSGAAQGDARGVRHVRFCLEQCVYKLCLCGAGVDITVGSVLR